MHPQQLETHYGTITLTMGPTMHKVPHCSSSTQNLGGCCCVLYAAYSALLCALRRLGNAELPTKILSPEIGTTPSASITFAKLKKNIVVRASRRASALLLRLDWCDREN